MDPSSEQAQQACLSSLFLTSSLKYNRPNSKPSPCFDVISVFPKPPGPGFVALLNELSSFLKASHPHAHHHFYSFHVQGDATLQIVRNKARILRAQLLTLIGRSLDPPTPIILIAHDIGISTVREALALDARHVDTNGASVLDHVRGLIFHESFITDESNEHVQVYVPEISGKQSEKARCTSRTSERSYSITAPRILSFGERRNYRHKIDVPRGTGEDLQQRNFPCHGVRTSKDKNELIPAVDAILLSPGFDRVPYHPNEYVPRPRLCDWPPSSFSIINPYMQSLGKQVAQYSPSLESSDIVIVSSQLVLVLLLAQILLTISWQGPTTLSKPCQDASRVAFNPLRPRSAAKAQDKPSPPLSRGNGGPYERLAQKTCSILKLVKHGTWPMTRQEHSHLQPLGPEAGYSIYESTQGVFNQMPAVHKDCPKVMLAHYRMFLVLMSISRTSGPDAHIVQCPTGTNRSYAPSKSQKEKTYADPDTGKAIKRPMQDADALDSDRSKRLDVGIKGKSDEPTDAEFPCPYFNVCPGRHRNCWKKRWLGNDLRKLKDHLYKEHERIVCNACHLAFRDRSEFNGHTHRVDGIRDFIEGFDNFQKDELVDKSNFWRKTGHEYYNEIWRILFPDRPDRSGSLAKGSVSRQELTEILQSRAREEQDRYRQLYTDLIHEVRSAGFASSATLSAITAAFNRNSPCDSPFSHEDEVLNSTPFRSESAYGDDARDASPWTTAAPSISPAVGATVATLQGPIGYQSVNHPEISNDQLRVDEDDDMYGDGNIALPPQPMTPHQPIPRRILPRIATLGHQQSPFMRNDFLDIPRNGEQWRYPHTGREALSSPSILETQSSSSPVPGLYQTSSNQDANNCEYTPVSSAYAEDDFETQFGELLQTELLVGVNEDKTPTFEAGKGSSTGSSPEQARN